MISKKSQFTAIKNQNMDVMAGPTPGSQMQRIQTQKKKPMSYSEDQDDVMSGPQPKSKKPSLTLAQMYTPKLKLGLKL